ncbi:MAG: hypothetical protein U9O56_07225 [Campylobacterota bacterium]|nr:hypothetical protein [Campylobacterota bacterium]
MGLKKYIFAGLLLIIAIFGYVFSIESGDYKVEIFDYTLILPLAVWIIAPTVLLFVVSVLHIIYYGLKNFFALKAVTKDVNSFTTLISKRILNEDSNLTFQNKQFKELADILKQIELDIEDVNFSTTNEDINKISEQLKSIKSGQYISEKELKLSKENPIMIQNLINRASIDDNFSLDVIKSNNQYNKAIIKKAFSKVLESKSMTTLKKHLDDISFDNDMLTNLFKKDSEQKNEFAMTNDQIMKLIKKVEFTNSELIQIANYYKSSMTPDQIIKLFEDIASLNEEYTISYLYVLSEYEVIDKIRDILVNSNQNEYTSFKALIDLKDAGKHTYSLDRLCYK